MLQKMILLACAGALGTLSRYALAGMVHKFTGHTFPFGTMLVNIIGCFLAGLIWSLAEGKITLSGEMRIIILVGFMGAFTTFSTYILESGELFRNAQYGLAFVNVLTQNIVGLSAMFAGIFLGRIP